ncbi:MAG: site-specific integrase [Leptolyngbyaceae cyanobacterium SM2_3_12]|nr:site-specific integrase [Leptolyngbyaceae cyanobacterium SM2_3_12]
MGQREAMDAAIASVNARLKAARLGLQIECRGGRLSLRGTLPPRPHSGKTSSHQQRIPLGLPATKAGLRQIEQEAKVIAARLIERTFDWHQYLPQAEPLLPEDVSLEERVAQFKAEVMARYCPNVAAQAGLKTTWKKAYAPYLNQLMEQAAQRPRQPLGEIIIATLEALPAHSRSRQVGCTALKAFAEFHQVELPMAWRGSGAAMARAKPSAGSYRSDQEIVTWYERIPNPAWRYVYGLMATYGLRNHEVFFCDRQFLIRGDAEACLTVLETTKTGLHDVWPFYPEWVDRFNLRQGRYPDITTDLTRTTLQRIGQQVSTQFKRYQIPFSPYDLRHAWAVRTIHFGLPDTVAARMMGHSVAIHNRTYHRWITRRDQQQAVRTALDKGAWEAPL